MESKKDTCVTNEAVLVQSVVCSKKVKLIAYVNTSQKGMHSSNIQFIPDLTTVQVKGTLLKDLMVIQGHVVGNVVADGRCLKKLTLTFQEEIMCEDICPGDTLKHTNPLLEGVLPPQIIPAAGHHEPGRVVFKVILSVQATVIREKLGTISVQIIGDINDRRCDTPQHQAVMIPCAEHPADCEAPQHHIHQAHSHNHIHHEPNGDFPCLCEECESGSE